jgi:hypothetical protein
MKFFNHVRSLCVCCFLLLGFSNQIQAQTARLTDDLSIFLVSSHPLSTSYDADISHYSANMSDQQTAEEFIAQFKRPYIRTEVDFGNLKAKIVLEINSITSTWTVQKWNEYLKTI